MRGTIRFCLLVVVALGLLAGCKQAQGEVCELTSDCASGLECCGRVPPAQRGLCLPAPCAAPPIEDAGQPPVEDAGTDAGPPVDSGTVDSGVDSGTP